MVIAATMISVFSSYTSWSVNVTSTVIVFYNSFIDISFGYWEEMFILNDGPVDIDNFCRVNVFHYTLIRSRINYCFSRVYNDIIKIWPVLAAISRPPHISCIIIIKKQMAHLPFVIATSYAIKRASPR